MTALENINNKHPYLYPILSDSCPYFINSSVFIATTNYQTNLESDNQAYQPSHFPLNYLNPPKNNFTCEDSISVINGLNNKVLEIILKEWCRHNVPFSALKNISAKKEFMSDLNSDVFLTVFVKLY